ncbi:MAG: hypothetical protein R3B94_09175 [Hyphomonas sp.]
MAGIDPALVKQVFDNSQRQWKPNIHYHRKLDDLGRRFEIAKRVLAHFWSLKAGTHRLMVGYFDNTDWVISLS